MTSLQLIIIEDYPTLLLLGGSILITAITIYKILTGGINV